MSAADIMPEELRDAAYAVRYYASSIPGHPESWYSLSDKLLRAAGELDGPASHYGRHAAERGAK